MSPVHHIHLRKRIHELKEQYPHPDKWKRFLDKIIYGVGIAGPLLVLPQVYKIWIEKDASGVSVTSWTGFVVIGVIWLLYAIVHKEKPLIITYIGFITIQSFVVIGALIYN